MRTRPSRVSDLSEGDICGEALGGAESFGRSAGPVPALVRADAHAIARGLPAVEGGDERVVARGGPTSPGRIRLFTHPGRSDPDGGAGGRGGGGAGSAGG